MNILIINRWNTSNLGDQAIGYAMESLCSGYGEITHADLCTTHSKKSISHKVRSQSPKGFVGIKTLITKSCPPILRDAMWFRRNKVLYQCLTTKSYDAIFIGGGELIGPGTFSVALKYWAKQINKHQPKAKLFFFGVGVASNCKEIDIRNMRDILYKANGIFVRDAKSHDNLVSNWGLCATEIPDLVFSWNNQIALVSCPRQYILYGITDFQRIRKHDTMLLTSESDYFEHSLKEIVALNHTGVKLFYTTQDDFNACQRFREYCFANGHNQIDIAMYEDLKGLITEMSHAKTVYSPRMHACILGKMSGAEVHPILISPKMTSFKEKYITNGQDINIYRSILEGVIRNCMTV